MTASRVLLSLLLTLALCTAAGGQERALMPIEFQNSLEFRWLGKPVLAARVLDDMSDPARTWAFSGTGALSRVTAADSVLRGAHALRVDMTMYVDSPAPTRNRLSSVNLRRDFGGEDWRGYNRISVWIRPELSGFPMLPLQLVLHNQGAVTVPDEYGREGIHYVTLQDRRWQQVVWEIEPLARDRITSLEIGYWVNKMLAAPTDRVAFEIARLELQRVEPDHVEGWGVAPGRIAFSHSGYTTGAPKHAFAGDVSAATFQLIRLDGNAQPEIAFTGAVQPLATRLGSFQWLDFSAVQKPGRYVLQAGGVRTQPFRIDVNPWRSSTEKALNFFFAERCGHPVPGSHGICHADWTATFGERRIPINGGWHDAGDLSQSSINTAEATYAMLALAEHLRARGDDPALERLARDEAKWGLEWLLRTRFGGGYRPYFASNNLWTNGIPGDADDRTREAKNNPTVNYSAAAAEALAARVLAAHDPALAATSLGAAADDWEHARTGTESADTRDTPAFAATRLELASLAVLASLELYAVTGEAKYAAHARGEARTILASQQQRFVGRDVPLSGFFYTGPDRDTLFHQFHRGNDQAPIVALARLIETFPDDAEWMKWYAAVVRHAEYQKAGARTTAPYAVLPAYVYHEDEHLQLPDTVGLHGATRAAFREQVRRGLAMGDGYYLRAFPVWFARRGNYGVLLAQAKALATAAQLRRDLAAAALAEQQLQWVVGRNPFAQSTMYGEGYDWAQQYSVSSGDFVGALPVGMQSRGNDDAPYWPAANMYVYKEVWVHPVARWLWVVPDVTGSARIDGRAPAATAQVEILDGSGAVAATAQPDGEGRFRATVPAGEYRIRGGTAQATLTALPGAAYTVDLRPERALALALHAGTDARGRVTIRLEAGGEGAHTFELRADNLAGGSARQAVRLERGRTHTLTWQAQVRDAAAPWVAVVIPDGDVARRLEVSSAPR